MAKKKYTTLTTEIAEVEAAVGFLQGSLTSTSIDPANVTVVPYKEDNLFAATESNWAISFD